MAIVQEPSELTSGPSSSFAIQLHFPRWVIHLLIPKVGLWLCLMSQWKHEWMNEWMIKKEKSSLNLETSKAQWCTDTIATEFTKSVTTSPRAGVFQNSPLVTPHPAGFLFAASVATPSVHLRCPHALEQHGPIHLLSRGSSHSHNRHRRPSLLWKLIPKTVPSPSFPGAPALLEFWLPSYISIDMG